MKFKQSNLANIYLKGLKGIEIGGSAHNAFGLNTINVDRYKEMNTKFKKDEIRICGEAMPVDIVARGDKLPFKDNEYDFVINSHVIEHFFDPFAAIEEWIRVSKKYVFMIVPHKERTFDKNRPNTSLNELINRHKGLIAYDDSDKHHSVWTHKSFLIHMAYLSKFLGTFKIVNSLNPDDKVGNGFIIILEKI